MSSPLARFLVLCTLALPTFAADPSSQPSPPPPVASLADQIDALATKAFPANQPGAAVLVVSHGQILLRKGYGMADLQLGVPMRPDDVFRIGSITKQFTAVAILQLVEAGKIHLDDDIAAYVPELSAVGQKITLRQLLNHTSGLPSFTEGAAFQAIVREPATLAGDLALIKGKPLLFPPGTDWRYVITGYRLLGAVIEKVTGQSYGDYIEEHIFKPAGMTSSAYDHLGAVVPRAIPGYGFDAHGRLTNAPYSNPDHTQAAGALLSNVDDLWKWEQALTAGKLVSPALLAAARANTRLPDGRLTGYGFGWGVGTFLGHPSFEHAGIGSGFLAYEIRVPDADVYVAVLYNLGRTSAAQGALPFAIVPLLLGAPAPLAAVVLPHETLVHRAGVYHVAARLKIAFVVDGDHLVLTEPALSGMHTTTLEAVSPNEFVGPTHDDRYTFLVGANDVPTRVLLHPRIGPERYAERVDEPLVDAGVKVPAEILERYVGDYEFLPQMVLSVKRTSAGLTVQMTGQATVDLIAESPVRFSVKQAPAELEFKSDAAGKITGLVMIQNGSEKPAKKIK